MHDPRHSIKTASSTENQHHLVSNALIFLERMKPLREPAKFWMVGVDEPGPTKSSILSEITTNNGDEDDWKSFFDEPYATERASSSRSRPPMLNVSRAMHSVAAQQARLSACWISLLPVLTTSPELSARALTVVHASITSEFRQAAKLMDWVSACVDYGEFINVLDVSRQII